MSFTLPSPHNLPLVPGEVRYVLEVYRGGSKVRAADIPLVSSVREDAPVNANVERTLGGGVVQEYGYGLGPDGVTRSGNPEKVYTIAGSSGMEHRLGAGEDGGSVFAGGLDLLLYFRRFLDAFALDHAEWEMARLTAPAPEPVLVFRAFREGWASSVTASLATDGQAPGNLRTYQLTLRAFGPPPPPELNALESFFATAAGCAKSATDFVDSATAWVAYAAGVTGGVVTVAQSYLEPINAVGRMMEQVSAVGRQGRRLSELPAQFVEAVFRAASAGATAMADIADAATIGTLSDDLDAFRREAAGNLDGARKQALEFLGARGKRVDLTSTSSSTAGAQYALRAGGSTAPSSPVTTVTLMAGESVTSVVRRLFGSLDNLSVVMALNDMASPTTLASGAPVLPGSTIVVPAPTGTPAPGVGGIQDLFGTDAALSADFDLIPVGDNDCAIVSDFAALAQRLRVRSTTRRGAYRPFPRVGLQVGVGQATTAVTPGGVASDVREQYTADRAVKGVGPVSVVTDNDRWIVECDVLPVSGGAVGVRAPVGV